jgi:proline iminopeptidase
MGFERMLLVGHSYGSFLALEYAARHPERLIGLVLCGSAPVLDYFETAVANARARATDEQFAALMNAMGASPPRTDAEMEEGTERVLPIYLHDPKSPLASSLMRGVRHSRDAFVHAFTHCLPHYDVRSALHYITVPTLILSGVDDWITPPEHGGARLHAAISGSEHVVFPASGHFPFAEEPKAFQTAFRQWLFRLAAEGRRKA